MSFKGDRSVTNCQSRMMTFSWSIKRLLPREASAASIELHGATTHCLETCVELVSQILFFQDRSSWIPGYPESTDPSFACTPGVIWEWTAPVLPERGQATPQIPMSDGHIDLFL